MSTEPAIAVDGLTKSFGTLSVLGGIDLHVGRGTIHALLGPNGAGKTTLVRILSTLTRPDGGSARVAGFDVVSQRHRVRRSISLTGQYAAVDDPQTGAENLRMMGRLAGLSRRAARARAAQLLEEFDLTQAAGRRVGTYSGGMRRRLDLAASLVGRPAIIFLDEPTTGLDLPARQAMWRVIAALAGSGVTVLLTTQYLEEADQLADRIAVLNGGRIIANGTAAELKARVAEQRLELTAADQSGYRQLQRSLDGRVVHADPTRRIVAVPTDGDAAHIRAVLDDVDPTHELVARFAVHAATLDDVFLTLTGHTARTTTADGNTAPVDTLVKENARV